MNIPIWQRAASIFIYMLPWSDLVPFGGNLFNVFPFLQWLVIPALPVIFLEQIIPLGSLLMFFLVFITLVRNPQAPYFIRFNALQAILIDIAAILISYGFRIFLDPLGSSLLLKTCSNTLFIIGLAIILFSIIECLQGKEPDLPGISEAVKIQL